CGKGQLRGGAGTRQLLAALTGLNYPLLSSCSHQLFPGLVSQMRNGILVVSAVFILIPGNARANKENLYYKLEKVWKHFRQSRPILVEGISNLDNLDYNLSLIAIRFEQIHDSLVVSGNTMVQVQKGCVKILDELVAKRGRPRIIED